jgi:hypothetical protein
VLRSALPLVPICGIAYWHFFSTPTPAPSTPLRDTERNLTSLDHLAQIPRFYRFFQYECGYAALQHATPTDRGIGPFKETGDYNVIGKGLAFQERLNIYLLRLEGARRQGYGADSLNRYITPVAEKLSRLLYEPATSELLGRYQAAMSEIDRQEEALNQDHVPIRVIMPAEKPSVEEDKALQW